MHAETLQLEQFIPSVVEQAISKCETKSALDDGLPYCDIKVDVSIYLLFLECCLHFNC